MKEHTNPVLCGGTYFTLILQAKKHDNNNDKILEGDVLKGLINIINPDYKKLEGNTFRTLTSQYKSCSKKLPRTSLYLPFTNLTTKKLFNDNIKNRYQKSLLSMRNFADRFLDINGKDKIVWLVKALLELIYLDLSIKDSDIFYMKSNGHSILKSELNNLYSPTATKLNIYFPAFLLGIWHFIVMNRDDNTIGEETFNSWHKKVKSSGQGREYIGTIGDNVRRKIHFIDIDECVDESRSKTELLLQNNDSKSSEIMNTIRNKSSIDIKAVETTPYKTPSKEMKRIFKEVSKLYLVEEFLNRDSKLIYLDHLFLGRDLSSYVEPFIATIRNEIINLFTPYKNEITYINIYHFYILMKKYNDYLQTHPKNSLFSSSDIRSELFANSVFNQIDMKSKQDTQSKKELDYYHQQLKYLYRKICNIDI